MRKARSLAIVMAVAAAIQVAPLAHSFDTEGDFVATGTILAGNPGSTIGGASEIAWSSTGQQALDGVDGQVIELPSWAPGHAMTLTGASETGIYDLDAYFYTADRDFISSFACRTPSGDESCSVPSSAAYVVVDLYIGAYTTFVLIVSEAGPGACVVDTNDPNYLAEEPGTSTSTIVVAVIDTGVNVLHERFARPALNDFGSSPVEAIDTETGMAPLYVPLNEPSAFEETACLTSHLESETLYRMAGTNLMYYSVLPEIPAIDDGGHGSATAGTVVANSPDAMVVMVQTDGAHLDTAIQWAADQPWIDVLSISWGCTANCIPFYPEYVLTPEAVQATRDAVDSGKIVVNSAGNDPTPHVTDPNDGPPWVIAVGGADPERNGETWIAAKAPDVISDFTVNAPASDSLDGEVRISGTSFAAPTIAGTLAGAVLQARRTTAHVGSIQNGALVSSGTISLDNADFREALNRTATYWNLDEYQPFPEGRISSFMGMPINPVAPWLQMGWGYANGGYSSAIASGLLNGALPVKPQGARDYMATRQMAREILWP